MTKHFLEILAEAMWEQHAQEKSWDELNAVEQEQMLFEAQHCIEALQEDGWAIIARTPVPETPAELRDFLLDGTKVADE